MTQGLLISHDKCSMSDEKCPRCNARLYIEDDRWQEDRGPINRARFECPACGGVLVISLWYSVDIEIDLPVEDWPEWRKVKYDDDLPTPA